MYSNTGYTLLAEIVAKVYGESFFDYTIFNPLEMNDTFFQADQDQIIKGRAYSYEADPNSSFKNSILSLTSVGACNLITNINDLSKIIDNFFTPKVGSKKVMGKMFTCGILNHCKKIDYACRIGVDEYQGF